MSGMVDWIAESCWACTEWFSHVDALQLFVLFMGGLLSVGYVTYRLADFSARHPESKISKALQEWCDCELPSGKL